MNGLGDQFLARAGFTRDQYGGIAGRDLLDLSGDLLHGPALTDRRFFHPIVFELVFQFAIFNQHFARGKSLFDVKPKFDVFHRLGDKFDRPRSHGFDRRIDRTVTGHHDNRDRGID